MLELREVNNQIAKLEEITKIQNERLNLISDSLVKAYDVLIKVKGQCDKSRAYQLKNQSLGCMAIVRCAQLFSAVFMEPSPEEQGVKRPYPSDSEMNQSKLLNFPRSIPPPNRVPGPYPGMSSMILPPWPTATMKTTMGLDLFLQKPQLRPIKKKPVLLKKKSKKGRLRPPSPPLMMSREPPRPSIKYIRRTQWHEFRNLEPGYPEPEWAPEQIYYEEVASPPIEQVQVVYPTPKFISRTEKDADYNQFLNEMDSDDQEMFANEVRLNTNADDEQSAESNDDDEEQFFRARFMEHYKTTNQPEKDPLDPPRNYKRTRFNSKVEPRTTVNLSEKMIALNKPQSSLWHPKYGRFNYQYRFRRPNHVRSNFHFPSIRRTGDPTPEMQRQQQEGDPTEYAWNLRKWNPTNTQSQMNN